MNPGGTERIRVGFAVLLAVAFMVLVGADLLGGSSAQPDDGMTGSVLLSESELVGRASSFDPRPYWVGPRPDVDRFEVERDTSNNLLIRYIPEDAEAGEASRERLRVATYPVPDARKSLEQASRSGRVPLSDRAGVLVLAPRDANSAYVVFDDQPDLQIEVFSPLPGEAAKLVDDGELIPLGWGPIE